MDQAKQPLTALLLDDDVSHAYLLSRSLAEIEDFQVDLIHFTTSERAMSDLLTQKADIVFLDHYLAEGQTGLELLRSLRDFGFDGGIVMLTGSDDDRLIADFRRYGADAYLCKSDLEAGRLSEVIQVAMNLPHRLAPRLLLDEGRN